MTYKMTPEYQKLLTEMIGEKLHKQIESKQGIFVQLVCSCGQILLSYEAMSRHISLCNRTFRTPDDMHKVFRWLVDNGKHWDLYNYAESIYITKEVIGYAWVAEIFAWLFYDPERFNVLVAMAREEGVIK